MFSFFKKDKTKEGACNECRAFLDGKAVPITEVPDAVFSGKLLGDGMAIVPESQMLKSPCDGVVSVVMDGSFHACGITLDNGMQILLHIGLDTVEMNGDGFEPKVKVGDRVKTGQDLIAFDLKKIEAAGHPTITILVVTEPGNAKDIRFLSGMQAVSGETVVAEFA